jgi:hypothetical protein
MSAQDFRQLERRREALRVPGMRGTLFLAPRESAGRIFAPFVKRHALFRVMVAREGVTDAQYAAVADRAVAAAREPMSPRKLQVAAAVEGISMGLLQRTIRGEGRMLAVADGSLRAANLGYVATDAWAPGALDVDDGEAALTQLAGDYLTAYGPARVADFAWWTGVARGVAARALDRHDTLDIGGGLLLHRADQAAFDAVKPLRGAVDLLPKWDPYTMGLAPDGRARLVHGDNQPRIYVRKGVIAPGQPNMGLPGDGYPVVLVDGEAVGTWNVTLKGSGVELFDTVGAPTRRKIDARLAGVEALLAG